MNTFLHATVTVILILSIFKDKLILKYLTELTERVDELEREDQ